MSELTDEGEYISDLDEQCLKIAQSELNEDEKNREGAIQTLREWIKQQPWLNSPTDEGPYVPDLDEQCLKIAQSELHEDDKNRDGAIETLRVWIKQQPWLNSPTGTKYLLRYLRNMKFSQLGARSKLESCWTFRTKSPDWFADRDPTDEITRKMVKLGFMLRLPRLDCQGRTFLLVRPGYIDVDAVRKVPGGIVNVFRIFTTLLDWITMDERAEINGIIVIVDQTNVTLNHKMHLYTTENMKGIATCLQHVYPFRLKKLNIYNPPVFMEAVLGIMKTFLKQKIKERFEIHGKSLVSLYEQIDKTVLPLEYLPDDYKGPSSGSVQSIADGMLDGLSKPEVVDQIKRLSTYRVNLDLKPKEDGPAASFRKLNIE